MDTEVEAELSMQSYLDRLDEELSKQPGFKRPPVKTIRKRRTTSKTDPDSGCINHGKKSGIGYLMETTVDCKYGIITGVDVYPANEKESLLVLRHLERQIQNGVPMQNIALDRGYDTGAVPVSYTHLDVYKRQGQILRYYETSGKHVHCAIH